MTFRGGYIFKNFEGTAESVLRELPVPETVYIPLASADGCSLTSLVKQGDAVRAGAGLLVSKSDVPCSLPSPVSGKVTCLDENGITISSDGSEIFEPVQGHTRAPWNLDHNDLFALSCSSGVQLLLGLQKKTAEDCKTVEHVIINVVHNGPLNQEWSPEMFGNTDLIADGIKTLQSIFPFAGIHTAVNKRIRKYFSKPEISELADIYVLSDRYPQENPELLARDTIHRKLIAPSGTINTSIIVVPYISVIQTAEVLTQGRPLIDRILMAAGPGVSRPGWYRIRIGTTFAEIKRRLLKSEDKNHWRIILGDLFSGVGIDDHSSVSPTDTEISVIREHDIRELFRFMRPGFKYDSYPKVMAANVLPIFKKQLDSNIHGGVRPCVQCNYCDEVCPVTIYPHLIWKLTMTGSVTDSFRYRPYDCVGCGLCDYVCPSKISLAEAVEKAKLEYRKSRSSPKE